MSAYDNLGFVIDYSLSVHEVYINVAKDLITTMGDKTQFATVFHDKMLIAFRLGRQIRGLDY
jgi:hypothetical protein